MTDQNLQVEVESLRPVLSDVVSTLEESAPYGAVFLSSNRGMEINIDNRQETVSDRNPAVGAIITAFDGITMRERAVGGFDKEVILRSARELIEENGFSKQGEIDPGPERNGDFATPVEIDPSAMPTKEKVERLRDLNRRANELDPRIVNVRVRYLEMREGSLFRNRSADLYQDILRVALYIFVVVADEGEIQFDWLVKQATGGWEALTFSDEELQSLADHVIGMLSAERIEPGEYTTITSPLISGVICHESFGHGVETDMFLKDRAKAEHYLGRTIGSPMVDIWDDPSVPGAFGSYYFDNEGWQATPTQIVKEGIFQRGITDLYSATVLGIPRTPNGRRQDFSRKTYARMSNTFFGRGTTPVDDLFKQVEDGIYIEKVSSGMEDPKGWGIQVTCRSGREIKGGEFTGRLFSPIVVTGYVPEILHSIQAVGDDLALKGGFCGKGHKELVPVASGGPHLLLKARLG
ncbi:MAG: TldD/PmbA family protein [Anaerolineales bacterium]|nr:TldD/PmbA family protein [Anaerolineales bacterium]